MVIHTIPDRHGRSRFKAHIIVQASSSRIILINIQAYLLYPFWRAISGAILINFCPIPFPNVLEKQQ